MSDATLARQTLVGILQTVVATVRSESAALETTSADLPVLTVFTQSDEPASDASPGSYRYTRTLVAELKIAATADYETQLDTYLAAIRKALYPKPRSLILEGHAHKLTVGAARLLEPKPQDRTAILQLQISYDYRETP